MNRKIFWTPIGLESLRVAQSFILVHWNQHVLDYFLDLIDKRIDQLKSNPKLAPKVESTEYRKLLIHKNVSIFYTLESEIIKILLVWDNRQDPRTLKEKLTDADSR
jgi:plasmid stabilization system protein ParE